MTTTTWPNVLPDDTVIPERRVFVSGSKPERLILANDLSGVPSQLVIVSTPTPDGIEYSIEGDQPVAPRPAHLSQPTSLVEDQQKKLRRLQFAIKDKKASIKRLEKGQKMLDQQFSQTTSKHQNYQEWNEFWIANYERLARLNNELEGFEAQLRQLMADPAVQAEIQRNKAWRQLSAAQARLAKLGTRVEIRSAPADEWVGEDLPSSISSARQIRPEKERDHLGKYDKYGGINVQPRDISMDQEPLPPGGEPVIRPTINYTLAVRDMVEDLSIYPVSIQPYLATGMHMALTSLAPWLSERFLERLKTLPGHADTADAPTMESIYFMGYPDRGGRDR